MSMKKELRSRRSALTIRGFQGRVVFFVVLVGFACVLINSYLYYSYVVGSYDFILKHSTLSQELIDERYRELYTLWISLTLISFVIILVVAVRAIFITHRATGPVYHIKRVMEEIKSGNSEARVRLRKNDEFQDLANSFNELVDQLQSRHTPNA